MVAALMTDGPWGIGWLRPEALFGIEGVDPLVHAVFWSLFLNTGTLVVVSLLTSRSALERVQAALFTDLFRPSAASSPSVIRGSATARDLRFVAERVFGPARAHALFAGVPAVPPPQFIDRLERELAGSIGAASAHVMLSKVVSGDAISIEEVFEMAGETRQAIEYSQELERTSEELRSTAAQLETANLRLRELDSQKDEFLSQVSHEVRTPMASIRSFSEILLEDDLEDGQRRRFVRTIHQESLRLTKLLDEILDLSALERGERPWENLPVDPEAALDRAVEVCAPLAQRRNMQIVVGARAGRGTVEGDADRLCQVLINLIVNAIKYNDAERPSVEVRTATTGTSFLVEVADNGPGIPAQEAEAVFDMFTRGERGRSDAVPGAGLGLAISRRIIARMSGTLELVQTTGRGACFRITLPASTA
jgi:signal transduction histidine kinase